MLLREQEFDVPVRLGQGGLIDRFKAAATAQTPDGASPVRFALADSSEGNCRCELGVIASEDEERLPAMPELFELHKRVLQDQTTFNAVMIVPTGIGAALGGHAGDATPAAQLLAQACDRLITHPNVINASDIAELPTNGLYAEGSVLTRLMMGTVGLQPVRSNRILVVIEQHPEEVFIKDTINAVNAARATYGLDCPEVIILDDAPKMRMRFMESGVAAGRIENLGPLVEALEERRGTYDAIALATLIDLPDHTQKEYFTSVDECVVNPWGGVEAMLTHAVSGIFNVPSAHAPMMESTAVANMNFGTVEPRKAAEMVSTTFFNCVLKGLQRSPRLVMDAEAMRHPSVLTAANISVLVQPDKCIGLPTLAALEQGIPVIAVRENTTIMRNRLEELPWAPGQFHSVANYLEAAGLTLTMRAGISVESIRRPLASTHVCNANVVDVDRDVHREAVAARS
ncbi:MAG: DUF3326 domain-containing protein [Planctomycetes bacterium]|nr:DUF3326 domain-containing protein [Planctomycetota bacterium]